MSLDFPQIAKPSNWNSYPIDLIFHQKSTVLRFVIDESSTHGKATFEACLEFQLIAAPVESNFQVMENKLLLSRETKDSMGMAKLFLMKQVWILTDSRVRPRKS